MPDPRDPATCRVIFVVRPSTAFYKETSTALSDGTIDYSIGNSDGRILPIIDTKVIIEKIIGISKKLPEGDNPNDSANVLVSRHPAPDRSTNDKTVIKEMIDVINSVKKLQPAMDKKLSDLK